MKENKFNIVLKEIPLPEAEYQKRVDEIGGILYELYCQSRLKDSIHQRENNNILSRTLVSKEDSV